MWKKAMEPTPADDFPVLVGLLEVNEGEEIRPRLREIFDRMDAEEKELRASVSDPVAEADQPFADPARILFGFTPRSEHKRIGARRALAARKRGVAERTMRTHQKAMTQELANYLLSQRAESTAEIPSFPTYGSLYGLPVGEWGPILKALNAEELIKVVAELAQSYRSVALAVADSRPHGPAPHWRNFFLGLQHLGERGFNDQRSELPPRLKHLERDGGPGYKFVRSLSTEVLRNEETPERYALIMETLTLIISSLFPRYTEEQRRELAVFADLSGGQQAVFLGMMGDIDTDAPFTFPSGPRLLAGWCALTAVRVDMGEEAFSRYQAIDLGFSFIWQLLHPNPRKRINMKALNLYLDTEGGTNPALPYRQEIEHDIIQASHMKLRSRPVADYLRGRRSLRHLLKEE